MQNGTGDYSDYHDILSDYSTLILSGAATLSVIIYKTIYSMKNFSNKISDIAAEISSDSEHKNLHKVHTILASLINMHKS
jgi:hypothetical protein